MDEKYTMTITLNVLNHLGINLYSNVPSVLSEIVANSWDADAKSVSISIDTDRRIINIIDDGSGMDIHDINSKYLSVGYAKREEGKESPLFHRPYMGRKGIGKLSMFSIAKTVQIVTKKNGHLSSFEMDIDDIAAAISDEEFSYHPKDLNITEDTDIGESGTKIVLSNLKRNVSSITPEYVKKRVARRFSIIEDKFLFAVTVNGEKVTIEDRDYLSRLEYVWVYGDQPDVFTKYTHCIKKTQPRNNIISIEGNDYKIEGWIGTAYSSGALSDGNDNLNKIVILSRGKVGQEDILSEFSEGGLYSKYLIGEIQADFFDDDSLDDMATSSRQEFRHDDVRYQALIGFIRNELKQIQSEWTNFRNETGLEKARSSSPLIGEWYDSLPPDDKKAAKKLFGKVNQVVVDDQKRNEILRYGILAFEKLRYSRKLNDFETIKAENLEALLSIITGFDDVEATLYYQIVKDRIEIIKRFNEIVDVNDKEKVVQKYLFDHLWLLDPSWERAEGSEFIEKSVLKALNLDGEDRLTQDEKAGRLDLGFRQTAGKYVIVELKRAGREVTCLEIVGQVMKYYNAISKVLQASNSPEVFEIIVVLGKVIDGDNSKEHRVQVKETLAPYKARIVYYDELINNAYNAYKEYIDKSREMQKLVGILDKIALEQSDTF